MRLGIDFGTTRTVVSACDRGNYPVISFFGSDEQDHDFFPSVVAEKDGELCFGFDALQKRQERGWTLRSSFKRLLSSPQATPGRRVKIGSSTLSLSDLVTRYLSALLYQLRNHSNLPAVSKDEPLEVAIAVPANAFTTQRLLTMEVFRAAGFHVVGMLNEPAAAGLEYAHRFRNTFNSRREQVLVYDLGGGTFDVSLVDMQGQAHDILTSLGSSRLGGDDFDRQLATLAIERVGIAEDTLSPLSKSRLRHHCREVKEAMNPNTRRMFVEVGSCLGVKERERLRCSEDHVEVIPIADFEAASRPLVDNSLQLLHRVLHEHGDASRVAGLYVVGGASALPLITRTLREDFPRRVHRSPYPSAAIAIGLAIAAEEKGQYRVNDRFHHHLGVFREADGGRSIDFDPIFGPDTALPGQGEPPTHKVRRYRPGHNIGHFRFLECSWLDGAGRPNGDMKPYADMYFPFDPSLQGRNDLGQLKVQRVEHLQEEIEERYSIFDTGAVQLTIANLTSGYEQTHRIVD